MKVVDVSRAAADAVAAHAARPATGIIHDAADARLVVFRLAPGQVVAPHRSVSTVTLTVISGQGFILGGDEERSVGAGHVAVFEPNELHGMRADTHPFVLLATITPRPGERLAAAASATQRTE
jgi:quercetin dioxygenase-like cupin family protein